MVPYWARQFADWFYGDSSSAKRMRYETRDWWLIGDLSKWYDTQQRNADYMKNKNINWDDVKYPSLMDSSSSGSWNALFSPSADVLERMYDDESAYEKGKRVAYSRYPIPRGGRKPY